jgi:hypothetical protein
MRGAIAFFLLIVLVTFALFSSVRMTTDAAFACTAEVLAGDAYDSSLFTQCVDDYKERFLP